MFFGNIAEIEITKDKDYANKLLNDGWVFIETKTDNTDGKFVFLLGRADYPRWEITKSVREKLSATSETV